MLGDAIRWVTGSGLDRVDRCPGSTVLPRHVVAEGTAATHGKRVHKRLELSQALPGLAPEQQLEWYPPGGHHEVQCWYDPVARTAGVDFSHKDRDYGWAPDHWVVGTVDFVHPGFMLAGRRVLLVDDLKTGAYPPSTATLQLALGATGSILGLEAGQGLPCFVSITHVPRSGTPSRTYQEFTPLHMAEAQEKLDTMYARHLLEKKRLDAGSVSVYKGSHCRYCQCKKTCPEWAP